MGLFNFKTNKIPPRFLAVDINSYTVKCAAYELLEDLPQSTPGGMSLAPTPSKQLVKIIALYEQPLEFGSVRNGNIVNLEAVADVLAGVLSQIEEELETISRGEKLKEVIFGIKGDLSLGLMTTVRVTREDASQITDREVNDIYKKTIAASYNQANNEVLEITASSDIDIEMVTSTIVYTKVDDLVTKDIVGASGHKIELAVFNAFTPVYHVQSLQKLAKALGLHIMAIGSDMYAAVKALSLTKADTADYVIMHVDSDLTDIAVVFGGGIVSTRTLYLGRGHFVAELAKKMALSNVEADALLKKYSGEMLTEEESLKIHDILKGVTNLWLSGIELLFTEFTGVKTFASKIFITGEGSAIPDLLYVLRKEPWTRSIPFRSPPEIARISVDDIKFIADPSGKLNSLAHVSIAALPVIYFEHYGLLNV